VIVGEGIDKARMLGEATDIASHVAFEPWTDDPISYYKSANVFLSTSNYEGYGLTLIEAVAAGCPVVTTDVGLVGSVFTEKDVLVCPVGDARCLARQINRLINDQTLRYEISHLATDALLKLPTEREYHEALRRNWEKAKNLARG